MPALLGDNGVRVMLLCNIGFVTYPEDVTTSSLFSIYQPSAQRLFRNRQSIEKDTWSTLKVNKRIGIGIGAGIVVHLRQST